MAGKFRLTDMDLDEISVVFSGDDPRAEVVIAKSATSTGDSSTVTANNAAWEAYMPDGMISKDDLPAEVVEYIDALEATVDSLLDDEGEPEPVAKSDDKTEDDDMDDFIAKADPRLLDMIVKAHDAASEANTRAEAAEAVAKAERDERLRRDAIAKAESLVMISDNTDDLAELLLALSDKPEVAEKVEKLFRAADAQIREGNLFTEVGKSVSEFSVSESVEAAAGEIAKNNPGMTKEQALVAAMEQNPAAYDESLKEG